jgi:uncharacterized protein (TIGR02996 family)
MDACLSDPVLVMLLEDIIAHPGDDGPRLAYADRLEETGAADARAEFIRCQLAEVTARCNRPKSRAAGPGSYCRGKDCCPRCGARWRAQDIFCAAADVAMFAGGWLWDIPLPGRIGGWSPFALHTDDPPTLTRFRRGFPSETRLPSGMWLLHGPALVRAAPLERVELPGVVRADGPARGWPAWAIFRGGGEGDIPDELFSLLGVPRCTDPAHVQAGTHCHFAERAGAESSLSRACLAWAASVATPAPAPLN